MAFFLEVGLLLMVVPWSTFWARNYFALLCPPLQSIVLNNFVRGGVSGLGLVNLILGFVDLSMVFTARARPDAPPADAPSHVR